MARAGLSNSTRLAALLFVAIFLPALALLSFMQLASARALAGQQAVLLDDLRTGLLAEYDSSGPRGLAEAIRDRLAYDPNGGVILSFADPFGQIVLGNIRVWPVGAQSASDTFAAHVRRLGDRADQTALMSTVALPDGSRLLVGRVTSGDAQLARANRAALVLAVLIAVPLSLGLAFILLRVIERRAARIAAIAEDFGAGDFSRRVPVDASGDAFDRLARALNAMLERIEDLVRELRLVTDGLAHDLRSPVTRLQVAVEQAAALVNTDRGAPEADEALQRAGHEAAALQGMLSTALQISRAEAGIGRDRFSPVDVDTMLEEIAEIYGPVAEDAGFALRVSAPTGLVASLHRELMAQAIGNLLDNALRYATGGRSIDLTATIDGPMLVIAVTDDGPGIAADRRAEAVRRFGRLDPARNRAGSGLGLALVEAATRLHGGRLELADAPAGQPDGPGLVVRMILPRTLPA